MCHRLTLRNAVPVEFREPEGILTLDKNQETLLYRIIQESVTNALKHARATKISITLKATSPFLYLSITDDGIGFDFPVEDKKNKMSNGLGLLNIESRAGLLGGELRFVKNVPSGVSINLKLKVSNDG